MSDQDTYETLADFGLRWSSGHLLDMHGQAFKFDVYPTKAENQKRYEKVGELVTESIYEMLKTNFNLEKSFVPAEINTEEEDPKRSFVFQSQDFLENEQALIVFINGSGVVRAGQWSRRVIMNDSLEEGSMFPYIEKSFDLGCSVLVLNTNEKGVECETSIKHVTTAWQELVMNSPAEQIIIIAHSAGGIDTVTLAETFPEQFIDRVKGVFFTDSVHGDFRNPTHTEVYNHLAKVGKNYVSSLYPGGKSLGQPIIGSLKGIHRYSSGSNDHIWTSHFAKELIFDDLEALGLEKPKPVKKKNPSYNNWHAPKKPDKKNQSTNNSSNNTADDNVFPAYLM